MPHFPPLGSNVCVDRKCIPEISRGAEVIATWCEDALHCLNPRDRFADPTKFLSEVLAYLDLAFRVQLDAFMAYAPKLHSRRLVWWREDLSLNVNGRSHSIIHDFIDFYTRKSDDAILRVVRAIQ